MQRRLGSVIGYGLARTSLPGYSCFCCWGSAAAASLPQRRFQSTAAHTAVSADHAATAMPEGAAAAPPAPAATADAGETPAHIRQLYKSSHKGRGTTPMPKPYQERKLRARRAPADTDTAAAATASTSAAAAPAPLFGARSSCAEDAGPVPQRQLSPLQKRQLQFRSKAAFVLTPQALRRVKYLLAQYAANHPAAEPAAAAASSSAASGAAAGAREVPCGIRIGVRRRGCSGYSYTVNYYAESAKGGAKAAAAAATSRKLAGLVEDVVVDQEGVKVVVDADALFYVIGTEMDYVVRNVEEKFTFKNPNQKYGCGCEESFMPYDADDMDAD